MNQKQFASEVTVSLQRAGHTAYWAGGCVRDAILGRAPKDYDVATSATPDEVRELFGFKRTLPIGASFGVITVVGPKSAGQIEVATFRRDGGYSDGRRPDSVEFTDAREDAVRRDFTINGMFFDPATEEVIDFVGGQEDIKRQVIRAIGDPHKRIEEDKLRMLRAVRFAATYEFALDPQTRDAVSAHAAEIEVVSGERIGAELVRMLSHPTFRIAVEKLHQTGLWKYILPSEFDYEVCEAAIKQTEALEISSENFSQFETVLAVLLNGAMDAERPDRLPYLKMLQDRWRLKNDQICVIDWVAKNWRTIEQADTCTWSVAQPAIVHQNVWSALDVAKVLGGSTSAQDFCRKALLRPRPEIDPPALLDGQDLIQMGVSPGPSFKHILQTVRNEQLDQKLDSAESARRRAKEIFGTL